MSSPVVPERRDTPTAERDLDFSYRDLLRVVSRAYRYRATTHPGVPFGCVLRATPMRSAGWTHVADLTASNCPDLPISWHRATDRVRVGCPPAGFIAPGTVDYHIVGIEHTQNQTYRITVSPVDPTSPPISPFDVPCSPSMEPEAYYQGLSAIRHAGGVLRLQPSFLTASADEQRQRLIIAIHGLAETYRRTPIKDFRGLR